MLCGFALQLGSTEKSSAQVDGNSSLVFRPLVKEQHGVWRCTASNQVAQISTSTSVYVLGELDLLALSHYGEGGLGWVWGGECDREDTPSSAPLSLPLPLGSRLGSLHAWTLWDTCLSQHVLQRGLWTQGSVVLSHGLQVIPMHSTCPRTHGRLHAQTICRARHLPKQHMGGRPYAWLVNALPSVSAAALGGVDQRLPPPADPPVLLSPLGTSPHAVTNVSVRPLLLAVNVSWEPGFDGGYFQRFSVWYTLL